MHEALRALVLDSKALSRTAMNETPTNQASSAGNSGAAPSTSDEQLMLAFSKGSSHAFKEPFSRHKQPIFGFFRRRVTESAQAEELTQETFVALLRADARYELAESGPTLLLWLMILSFPAWLLWRRYQRSLAMGSASGV